MTKDEAAVVVNRVCKAIGEVVNGEALAAHVFVSVGVEADGEQLITGAVGRGNVPVAIFNGIRSLPLT